MILLSFRRNFDSRLLFSVAPLWKIPPGESIAGKRCLFMIHGYENTAGAAEGNFENIERNLTDFGMFGPGKRYDQLVGVLWPGQTALGFWLAEAAADNAADMLRDALADQKPASASFVTHSLGARVALRYLSTTLLPFRPPELVLLAPAVDNDCLGTMGRYRFAVRAVDNLLVCYSSRDEVLGVWFRRFSAFLNFNDLALGYSGPNNPARPAGVGVFDGTRFVDSHGAWMSCKEMYAVWRNRLR